MKIKYLLIMFAYACITLFTGCSNISEQNLLNRRLSLANLNQATASGKIAIKETKNRLSSNFYVELNQNGYELTLNGITGSTILRLTSTNDGATIIDQDGNVYHGLDAEELVKKLTGLNIPCNKLPDIIKGTLYSGNQTTQKLDEIVLAEYTITYNSFTTQGSYTLPQRITITGNNTKIRINITKWAF